LPSPLEVILSSALLKWVSRSVKPAQAVTWPMWSHDQCVVFWPNYLQNWFHQATNGW
jgi:hypothetical protein